MGMLYTIIVVERMLNPLKKVIWLRDAPLYFFEDGVN